MENNALHHSPTREYSHAWGEWGRGRATLDSVNRPTGSSESPEILPLEQLSPIETGKRETKRNPFISLTRLGKNDREQKKPSEEIDQHNAPDALEERLARLQTQLSDYRWKAEIEIIDRTSDAVVHLDHMANEYRAGVRAELEKFRDESGDQSQLRSSLVDSALRRLSGVSNETDQFHHFLSAAMPSQLEQQQRPIFFNYLPRPEADK